jgi:hypothetical protein
MGDTETKVFQSHLNPAIPMFALSHLPPDSPVIVLKPELNKITAGLIERLYSIVPSLNDSSFVVLDEVTHAARGSNA